MREKLNKVLKFTPHYAVFGMRSAVDSDMCDASGEFCAEAPEQGGGLILGRHVLEEDVRQLCIHELDQKNSSRPLVGYAEHYWEYVARLADSCALDLSRVAQERFGTECSEQVMKAVGLDVATVRECMNMTRDRKLKSERENTAWSTRALRINGWRYAGAMDAELVTRAVCSGFVRRPAECETLLNAPYFIAQLPLDAETSDVSMYTLVSGLISIVGTLLFGLMLYKRGLKAQLQRTIREEAVLEVQSQMTSYTKMPACL